VISGQRQDGGQGSRTRRGSRALRSTLLALVALCGLRCAVDGAAPPPNRAAQARAAGDPAAPPTLTVLPELPARAPANSERTHQGILLARQALDACLPAPPVDRSFAALQSWADDDVSSWVVKRRDQIEAARARMFDGRPSPAEQILGHAVLALLHEDTARALSNIPAPKELDDEQQIAAMYRDLVSGEVDAFVTSALIELRDCVELAHRGPAEMHAYDDYCRARFERLRGEQVARLEAHRASGRGEHDANAKSNAQ
jgi:hypothetical protein